MGIPAILNPQPLSVFYTLSVKKKFQKTFTGSVIKTLNYNQQPQQQDQWCWAACTVSIHLYFKPGNPLTQCQLVNTKFGRADCCINPASAACNQGAPTAEALQLENNLNQSLAYAVSFDTIQQEIYLRKANPVCCSIGWPGGGGHAVVVYGYSVYDYDGYIETYVYVQDPWYGQSITLYSNFRYAYQGNGTWRATFLTKSS